MTLPARPSWLEDWRSRDQFTLLDCDFGEGVSFIRLWECWRLDPARPERLHIVALSTALPEESTLAKHLRALTPPRAHGLVEQLLRQWPLNMPGIHRLDFEDLALTLTLAVGPVERMLSSVVALVDAVLLSESMLKPVATPDALLQSALQRLARDPARLLLVRPDGHFNRGDQVWSVRPEPEPQGTVQRMLRQPHVAEGDRRAVVVGAGVAGAGVAHALALRGWRVQVMDLRQRRVLEHGRHHAAALTPMVTRDDDIRARLSRAGSLRAHARWSHVTGDVIWRCGALQLQRVSGRIVELSTILEGLGLPQQWVSHVSRAQASDIAGLPVSRGGLYFPTAARIRPERLIETLLQTPGIETVDAHVDRVLRVGGLWQLLDRSGQIRAQAPQVILASAFGTQALLRNGGWLESEMRMAAMHQLGGEITLIPDQMMAGGPRCIIAGDGYVLPSLDGVCVVGSSYVHGVSQIESSLEGARGNMARAAALLEGTLLPDLFDNFRPQAPSKQKARTAYAGWAGWRAVLPGRLPVVGPVAHAEGLWVASGFASRGLTWSSLAGDLIAGALSGEPLMLERDIMDKISQT